MGKDTVSTDAFLFDVGTPDSPLRRGFSRVTSQTVFESVKGYGWANTEGLYEHHKAYREWIHNESRGTEEPPPIYTNEVTEDAVLGRVSKAFRVRVAPGDYLVETINGLSEGSPSQVLDFSLQVNGCRKDVVIPGPYRFEHLTFHVSSQKGFIELSFNPRSLWAVNAIIVRPADETGTYKQIIDQLLQEIYFLPPDVASKWREERRPVEPVRRPNREEASRGYILHHRHYLDVVFPHTSPGRPLGELGIFASLGEYEPVTFCVYPLKGLQRCEVLVSDLRGPGIIPSEEVEIRKVRFVYARPNYDQLFSYHVVPDILDRYTPGDLHNGMNHRFWLTVHVPEDATPGTYRADVTFSPSNAPSSTIPLRLEVLPIRLRENPERMYAIYYHNPLSLAKAAEDPISREYWRRKAEAELADMKRHGTKNFTTGLSTPPADEEGKFSFDFDAFQEEMDLRERFGFRSPIVLSIPTGGVYRKHMGESYGSHLRNVRFPPEGFFSEMTRMVEAVEEERKRRGWPEFLYYPVDEPNRTPEAVRFMVGVLKAIKEVAGVRTYVTADPTRPEYEPMRPYVDIWCTQPFLPDFETVTKEMKAGKVEYWCYPNHVSGENDHTPVAGARMTYGFGFWRSGFKALIPWIYQANIGDPFNYLDGPYMDFLNRSESDGTPIPVILWEAFREGYDDYRYIYTLERLIAEVQGDPRVRAEAERSRKLLTSIWRSIRVQAKYKYEGLWQPEVFDKNRRVIAREIIRLQELRKKP